MPKLIIPKIKHFSVISRFYYRAKILAFTDFPAKLLGFAFTVRNDLMFYYLNF
jgi:hypothetical protein